MNASGLAWTMVSAGPARVCALGGGLLGVIWGEKHGDRSCQVVRAQHHRVSRAEPMGARFLSTNPVQGASR